MSVARASFLERCKSLSATLSEAAVQDGALHEVEKNAKARLLRNGLAVVSFAFLEDFIRQRCSELLAILGTTGLGFAALPSKVQIASTFGLLRALSARVKLEPDSLAKISMAQDHAAFIASTSATPFQLSPFSFGYDGSNVSADEVEEILKAFRVQAVWGSIGNLASKVGLGSLSLETAFVNAAKRRHRAAHVAGATTPLTDLENYIKEAMAIAFGFDVLLSAAIVRLKRRDVAYLGGGSLSASSISIVLISEERGRFKEKIHGAARARVTAASMVDIDAVALPRADIAGNPVAYLNSLGQLERWSYPSAT